MKKFKLIICLLCFQTIILAQDSTNHYEFGPSLLTVNSINTNYTYAQVRPSFEILNGIFFRYNKKYYAYRALISYVENKIDFEPPAGSRDGISGSVSNKNLMLGGGYQKNLKKNKDWLYAFIDACYRNTFSTGNNRGGIAGMTYNNKYSSNSNALDTYFGLGLKLKIMKQVSLSSEFNYNIYFGKTITRTSYQATANLTSSTHNLTMNSLIKIHLTVKF